LKHKSLQNISLSALFAALAMAMIILHVPAGTGILHAGDAVILLAACLLPKPYAMAAGAVGGGLANWQLGLVPWIPFTVVIKAAVASLFSARHETLLTRRNMLMCLPYALITMGGYFIANAVIYGWQAATLQSLSGDFIQSLVSTGLFYALAAAMDKAKLKRRLR